MRRNSNWGGADTRAWNDRGATALTAALGKRRSVMDGCTCPGWAPGQRAARWRWQVVRRLKLAPRIARGPPERRVLREARLRPGSRRGRRMIAGSPRWRGRGQGVSPAHQPEGLDRQV